MADVDKPGDLLWAVLESQIVLDGVPGLRWRGAGVARASSAGVGALLGESGVIALTTAIVGDLAVDGAGVVANALRNSADGKALGQGASGRFDSKKTPQSLKER
jgi:hypothetical protein